MSQYRVEAIEPNRIKTDPIRCPWCSGRTLTLRGLLTRDFSERLQSGKVVERAFGEDMGRETEFIDCHDCKITFHVMTEEEHRLLVKNFELEQSLLFFQSPNFVRSISNVTH